MGGSLMNHRYLADTYQYPIFCELHFHNYFNYVPDSMNIIVGMNPDNSRYSFIQVVGMGRKGSEKVSRVQDTPLPRNHASMRTNRMSCGN